MFTASVFSANPVPHDDSDTDIANHVDTYCKLAPANCQRKAKANTKFEYHGYCDYHAKRNLCFIAECHAELAECKYNVAVVYGFKKNKKGEEVPNKHVVCGECASKYVTSSDKSLRKTVSSCHVKSSDSDCGKTMDCKVQAMYGRRYCPIHREAWFTCIDCNEMHSFYVWGYNNFFHGKCKACHERVPDYPSEIEVVDVPKPVLPVIDLEEDTSTVVKSRRALSDNNNSIGISFKPCIDLSKESPLSASLKQLVVDYSEKPTPVCLICNMFTKCACPASPIYQTPTAPHSPASRRDEGSASEIVPETPEVELEFAKKKRQFEMVKGSIFDLEGRKLGDAMEEVQDLSKKQLHIWDELEAISHKPIEDECDIDEDSFMYIDNLKNLKRLKKSAHHLINCLDAQIFMYEAPLKLVWDFDESWDIEDDS